MDVWVVGRLIGRLIGERWMERTERRLHFDSFRRCVGGYPLQYVMQPVKCSERGLCEPRGIEARLNAFGSREST